MMDDNQNQWIIKALNWTFTPAQYFFLASIKVALRDLSFKNNPSFCHTAPWYSCLFHPSFETSCLGSASFKKNNLLWLVAPPKQEV